MYDSHSVILTLWKESADVSDGHSTKGKNCLPTHLLLFIQKLGKITNATVYSNCYLVSTQYGS